MQHGVWKGLTTVGCKGVIFDLDGTLIDTLEDLTASMNYALIKLGCNPRRREECRRMIGNGLPI